MEEKRKYLIKYVTERQVKAQSDRREYIKPKSITIEAETERAAQYALWISKKGPEIDRIISVREITKGIDASPALQYKVGWYDKNEKRRYRDIDSKEEALDLIAALMDYPGQISIKQITPFKL